MTAASSLRRQVANLLDSICACVVCGESQRLHDTCLVLADACEEDGLGKFANFWRLVATRQVWPLCKKSGKHFEWWDWDGWVRWISKYRKPDSADRAPFLIDEKIFSFLPGKEYSASPPLRIRYYRSLSKAILSLEKAWGAVDCEAASV